MTLEDRTARCRAVGMETAIVDLTIKNSVMERQKRRPAILRGSAPADLRNGKGTWCVLLFDLDADKAIGAYNCHPESQNGGYIVLLRDATTGCIATLPEDWKLDAETDWRKRVFIAYAPYEEVVDRGAKEVAAA